MQPRLDSVSLNAGVDSNYLRLLAQPNRNEEQMRDMEEERWGGGGNAGEETGRRKTATCRTHKPT